MATFGNTGRTGSKREKFALALAGGRSVRAAAKVAGVSLRSAYRWSNEDEEFQAMVQQFRNAMAKRATAVLTASLVRAAKKLDLLRESKDDRVAIAACKAILEHQPRLHERDELVGRLDALERLQARNTPRPRIA